MPHAKKIIENIKRIQLQDKNNIVTQWHKNIHPSCHEILYSIQLYSNISDICQE